MIFSSKKILVHIRRVFVDRIWDNSSHPNYWKDRLKTFLRIMMISYQRFLKIDFKTQAAALTYFTLVSTVPVFAIIFAIAKGFNLQEKLYTELLNNFESQRLIVEQLIAFTENVLGSVNGGVIAGVSIFLIVITLVQVMMTVEKAFNLVWGVTQERTWIRKFTDYFVIVAFSPIFLIAAGSINIYVSTTIQDVLNQIGIDKQLEILIDLITLILPYSMIWIGFTFIYMSIPNKRVPIRSAFYAAIISGTIFQLTQIAYIYFQIGVSKANAIYGSFAALPLFFVWLYLSWRIVLLGVIISFAHYKQSFTKPRLGKKKSFAERINDAFLIWDEICASFNASGSALITERYLLKMRILSDYDLNKALTHLVAAKLIHEIDLPELDDRQFAPSINPDKLTKEQVFDKLLNSKVL